MKKNSLKNYINVYNNSISKKDFIIKLLKQYKNISKATAERNYYRINKLQQKEKNNDVVVGVIYNHLEKEKPHDLKIIIVKDMIRLKSKITREILKNYGFNDLEINWLIDAKILPIKI